MAVVSRSDGVGRVTRTYSKEQKAEAVALAASLGSVRAARQLQIPVRSVTNWLHRPAGEAIIREAEHDIADRLRDAHAKALDSVMEGLQDKRTRLGERARALEVLGQQLALAEGRATANIASTNINIAATAIDSLSWQEAADLRDWLDRLEAASDAELEAEGPALLDAATKLLGGGSDVG